MTFGEHVFLYCERGTSPALLAEPFNAVSNAAFLLAALAGLGLVLLRPAEQRNADLFLLPVLVLFVGLGSLAFHLYANQGTELVDVVPISVFMLVYLGFALNRFLGVPPGFMVLAVIGFGAVVAMTGQVQCSEAAAVLIGETAQGAKPCLNGSIFYLPALFALIVVGLVAKERGHKAAPWLLWAAAIFAVSITLRSLDLALCDKVLIEGRKVGTHFVWHILNALTLFLLLRASLTAGPLAANQAESLGDTADKAPVQSPEAVAPPTKLSDRVAAESGSVEEEEKTADDSEEKPKVFFPA